MYVKRNISVRPLPPASTLYLVPICIHREDPAWVKASSATVREADGRGSVTCPHLHPSKKPFLTAWVKTSSATVREADESDRFRIDGHGFHGGGIDASRQTRR